MLTVKVKVGVVGEKGLWSLSPNGRFGTRSVFQRSSIRVELGGERVARTLVILEWGWPLLWHGGRATRGIGSQTP